jgi:hypothetical protein
MPDGYLCEIGSSLLRPEVQAKGGVMWGRATKSEEKFLGRAAPQE